MQPNSLFSFDILFVNGACFKKTVPQEIQYIFVLSVLFKYTNQMYTVALILQETSFQYTKIKQRSRFGIQPNHILLFS